MQKKIIALAIAAAFAAPVAAMADVTVYGVVDGNFRSATSAGSTSNTMNSFAGLNSNRWGVKSSEDLGDGMKANVGLEGDLFTATGVDSSSGAAPTAGQIFSRQSTVGLEGGFGKIDLGRQYTVAFKMNTLIDPFGHQFIGLTSANYASGFTLSAVPIKPITRNDSDISYTGKFGDVTVMADKSMGSTGYDTGATAAAGVSYVSGPITAVVTYSKIKPTVATVTTDVTHLQVGGGYNFGDGSVKVGYAQQKNADSNGTGGTSVGNDATTTSMWLGGNFNVSSKIGVTAAYYKLTSAYTGATDVVTTNIVAAATYALSKKTALYVEADKQSVDTSPTTDTNGYTVGMNVAF